MNTILVVKILKSKDIYDFQLLWTRDYDFMRQRDSETTLYEIFSHIVKIDILINIIRSVIPKEY